MSGTLEKIRALVARGAVRATEHAYERFEKRDIYYEDVLSGLKTAVEI